MMTIWERFEFELYDRGRLGAERLRCVVGFGWAGHVRHECLGVFEAVRGRSCRGHGTLVRC